MKHFHLLFFSALLMLSSCTTNYYLVVSDADTPVYNALNEADNTASIQAGKAFLYTGSSNKSSIRYGSVAGYSSKLATWKRLKKLSKKQAEHLTFTTSYGYVYNGIPIAQYQYGRPIKNTSSGVSSSSGSSTRSTSSGGTVNVKGYTRKDGTYVSPHTRSAPRRH